MDKQDIQQTIQRLKTDLALAKQNFDPYYRYSDDPRVFHEQRNLAREIDRLESLLVSCTLEETTQHAQHN